MIPAHPQTRLYIGAKEVKAVYCLRHKKWVPIKDETMVIRRVPTPREKPDAEKTTPLF